MRVIPAMVLFCLAIGVFYCGMNCGKSYEEVKAYMQSEDYKAQGRAFRSRF